MVWYLKCVRARVFSLSAFNLIIIRIVQYICMLRVLSIAETKLHLKIGQKAKTYIGFWDLTPQQTNEFN